MLELPGTSSSSGYKRERERERWKIINRELEGFLEREWETWKRKRFGLNIEREIVHLFKDKKALRIKNQLDFILRYWFSSNIHLLIISVLF